MSTPSITIFVRHSAGCPNKLEGEFFKRCNCRKHLRWFHNGSQHRQSAKTRSWAHAEAERRKLEARFEEGETAPALTASDRKTLEQAIQVFIASKHNQGLSRSVLKKHERELARLLKFLTARSKIFPSEIQLHDLEEFRSLWQEWYPSSLTRQKVQERLRAFLSYCLEAQWIDRVPKLSAINVDEPPTLPLTDTEYTKLLEQCAKEFQPEKAKKVHAFIQCMRHSGLAIRDAVTLERAEIIWDKKKNVHRIETSRQKTGVHVSVPLPPDVSKEVLEVLNGNDRYVFWNRGAFGGHDSDRRGRQGKETTAVTTMQTDLRNLFRAAGLYLEDQHMVSHRLRDTFAVSMLSKGVPMEEVARMLGNSLKVCEKHYAKWAQARQDRLDDLVIGTWKEKLA
jgi:integrase/recombinase XerD